MQLNSMNKNNIRYNQLLKCIYFNSTDKAWNETNYLTNVFYPNFTLNSPKSYSSDFV